MPRTTLAYNDDMISRTLWMMAVALAAVTLVGCPRAEAPQPPRQPAAQNQPEPPEPARPDGVVGYYTLDDARFYGVSDMKNVPPGQVMHLGIEKGRWMMRDMLSALGGTCAETKSGAILTVTVSPSGPNKKKVNFHRHAER